MSQETPSPVTNLMDPPSKPPQMNHGRTLAGWFLFWASCVGILIVAFGAIRYNWAIIATGVGVAVAGLIISAVLRLMGHGQPRGEAHSPTVEDL